MRTEPVRRSGWLVAALALLALLAMGCAAASPREPASAAVPARDDRLHDAIERAIAHLRRDPSLAPPALPILDALHRWFALEEFDDMAFWYDFALRTVAPCGRCAPPASDAHPGYVLAMRRLLQVQDFPAGSRSWEQVYTVEDLADSNIRVVILPALYCDQVPLPSRYDAMLRNAFASGGYRLTHVGLALVWMRELGCTAPVAGDFAGRVADAIAEIPNADAKVTDLEIEATAFLYYMGRGDLVSEVFVDRLIEAQQRDGGWLLDSTAEGGRSNWHPSSLALWVLLEFRKPGLATGTWIPRAPD